MAAPAPKQRAKPMEPVNFRSAEVAMAAKPEKVKPRPLPTLNF